MDVAGAAEIKLEAEQLVDAFQPLTLLFGGDVLLLLVHLVDRVVELAIQLVFD